MSVYATQTDRKLSIDLTDVEFDGRIRRQDSTEGFDGRIRRKDSMEEFNRRIRRKDLTKGLDERVSNQNKYSKPEMVSSRFLHNFANTPAKMPLSFRLIIIKQLLPQPHFACKLFTCTYDLAIKSVFFSG